MKKALLLFGLLLAMVAAHVYSQFRLFSIFQIVTSIPLFLLLLRPAPAVLIACTFILLEIYSSLPYGSMVLMFAIPYIVIFLWKKFRVELSWKFFFGVLCIIILQNVALLSIVALSNLSAALDISWHILSLQIIATSIVTYILSFIYHEYSARL